MYICECDEYVYSEDYVMKDEGLSNTITSFYQTTYSKVIIITLKNFFISETEITVKCVKPNNSPTSLVYS